MAAPAEEAASSSSDNGAEPLENELRCGFVTVDSVDLEENESKEAASSSSGEKDNSINQEHCHDDTPDFGEDFVVVDSLNEEEIDFCSPKFNPSVALKSDKITVPFPDIMTFNSLTRYEDAIKQRKKSREGNPTPKGESRSRSRSKTKAESRISTENSGSVLGPTHSKQATPESIERLSLKPSSSRHGSKSYTGCGKQTTRLRKPAVESRLFLLSQQKEQHSTRKSTDLPHQVGEGAGGHLKKDFMQETVDPKSQGSTSKIGDIDNHPSSRQRGKREIRNVFTRMEAMKGPLAMLSRCVKNKELVRVLTRGAVTLSSVCRGYIVAFDKFFNMALIDVDEIYRRPAALGKVKARISHNLLDAQKTLTEERDECRAKWKAKCRQTGVSENIDSAISSGALFKNQEQSNLSEKTSTQQQNVLERSKQNPGLPASKVPEKIGQETIVTPLQGTDSKTSKLNLRLLKSVYSSVSVPKSRYEREALMLGIPDENVEHRHLNQLLLRGDNVVSVSIIEDF